MSVANKYDVALVHYTIKPINLESFNLEQLLVLIFAELDLTLDISVYQHCCQYISCPFINELIL